MIELEGRNIISKVEYPTEWVNNMVIVEKPNGQIRVCLDPRHLNNSIKKEQFPIPTSDEISSILMGKSLFTVLDMKDGFLQIKLDKFSSDLCCFITPFGKYKWNRLPFGLSVSPEVFQRVNTKMFGDIPNVGIYFDDVIICGKNTEEHDEALEKVVDRARKFNVKFNIDKLQFRSSEVKFLGLTYSSEGVRPDEVRLKAISEMERPLNKKELLRFLGMANFLMKFIPNLSTITAPLRLLVRDNVEWVWGPEQETCFKLMKQKIIEAPTLQYFNGKLPIIIQCDASQYGVGACLFQSDKPVAFASRTLTKTEINYAQIEKEMLAICFAVDKFHEFVYGHKILIQTDHKPLVSIINKDLCKVTARLQRLKLRLLKYEIELVYLPGKKLVVADQLSRSCLKYKGDSLISNEVVHSLTSISLSDKRKKQFIEEVDKDGILKKVKDMHLNDNWAEQFKDLKEELKFYWKIKDEITVCEGLIFYKDRVVVPKSLRPEMKMYLHEPHLGFEKTKKRAKDLMFWPNMCQEIEDFIANCQICQRYSRSKPKQLLKCHEFPDLPFEKVGADIMDFKSKSYLIIVDYYSKWVEIHQMKNKTSEEVISIFKNVFSCFGIPKVIISDNMPFNSFMMKEFSEQWGFELRTVSPHYPKSNGLAEKFVGIAKTLIKKTDESASDFQSALLEYRNSPISGTNVSPAELLMNRKLRTKLPIGAHKLKPRIPQDVRPSFEKIQNNSKSYYDRTARPEQAFEKNERIYIQNTNNKEWERGIILEKANTPRSYIVETDKGNVYRRNAVSLKKDKNCEERSAEKNQEESGESDQAEISGDDERLKQSDLENSERVCVTRSGRVIRKPIKLDL